ncbi:hypothetical protein MNV49_005019 [Pseudohyphozyma bogoriensis]|nr:hypothetical protein MNV49_005019 [Pseudohyphozyma bogoriensis]
MGWTNARRQAEGVSTKQHRVVLDDSGVRVLGGAGGGIARKRSSPGLGSLAESTNVEREHKASFAEKLLRMKRGKSISNVDGVLENKSSSGKEKEKAGSGSSSEEAVKRATVEPFVFLADTSDNADRWVTAINAALAKPAFSFPPKARGIGSTSSGLTASASLPTGLSNYGNKLQKRPPTAPSANNGLPPDFNAGRRPSFLDRPPPSPRDYVTITAASPESSPARPSTSTSTTPAATDSSQSSDVPAWIQAVRTAGSSTSSHNQSSAEDEPLSSADPGLKPKRSLSLLAPSTARSGVMERVQSDPGSIDGGGGGKHKLLGFLGKRSSSKRDARETKAAPARTSTSSSNGASTRHLGVPALASVYADARKAASSSSLPESLVSESVSTAASSDLVLTPEMNDADPSSVAAKLRPSSPLAFYNRPIDSRPSTNQTHLSSTTSTSNSGSLSTPTERTRSGRSEATSWSTYSIYSDKDDYVHFEPSSLASTQRMGLDEFHSTLENMTAAATAAGELNGTPARKRSLAAASSSTPATTGAGGGEDKGEHIIKPSDLILQMKEEVDLQKLLATRRRSSHQHQMFGSMPKSSSSANIFGGLSPPPAPRAGRGGVGMARSGSKQSLSAFSMSNSSMAMQRSVSADTPSSTPVVQRVRRLSIGVAPDECGEEEKEVVVGLGVGLVGSEVVVGGEA